MKTNVLTHIVPTLPPQSGSAGEYAFILASQLRDQYGINSKFILCNPDWDGPTRIGEFVIRRLRLANEAGLWGMLASLKDHPSVLLHYDGCAYNKNGTPAWLYRGIKSWLDESNHGVNRNKQQFITIFHKMWESSTKPWESAFYLQPLQQNLVKKLHSISQSSVVTTPHSQSFLETVAALKTWLLPVPANLPIIERPQLNGGPETPLRVAIWGEPLFRADTLRRYSNLLHTLDKANRLACVMLIGRRFITSEAVEPDVAFLKKNISSKRIETLRVSCLERVALALSQSDLILFPFGGRVAFKSGCFMSALATGCAAVLCDGKDTFSLQEGKHFIACDDSASGIQHFMQIINSGELEQISTAGRTWYQRHADWNVIARKYQELLQGHLPAEATREHLQNFPIWSQPTPVRHAD